MAYGTWILFLLVSLAAVLSPGPAMLAILGHALARGGRSTVPVVFGNAFGAALLIGASVAGLAALLAALPHGLEASKWAGGAYLLWLGVRAWHEQAQADGKTDDDVPSAARSGPAFRRGVLIALSNPKALLFFGAVLPQFVDPARPVLLQFVVMAATFVGLELAATGIVTVAAHALAPSLQRPTVARIVKRAGGAVMIAAAALLALTPVRAFP